MRGMGTASQHTPFSRMRHMLGRARIAVALLTLSASGLVGIVLHEGYTEKAVIPTKGDRPTVGHGSTFRDDGTPVQMGDTITPPKALARTRTHINNDEAGLKRCVTAPLNQVEYDILVDFAYQYGVARTCSSSMVANVNRGHYAAACGSYTAYRLSGTDRYDCSTLVNGKPNQRCWGVWQRNLERQAQCLAAQ